MRENSVATPQAQAAGRVRGVLDDAISVFFVDATLASAFVARWCQGSKAETAGGVFQVREDQPSSADRGGPASDAMSVGRDHLPSDNASAPGSARLC